MKMNKTVNILSLSVILTLTSCSPRVSNLKVNREGGRYSEAQANYLNSTDYSDTSPYCGNLNVSSPNPIKLTWEGNHPLSYVNVFADEEKQDLIVRYKTSASSFEFYNDELMKDYYFTVSAVNDSSVVTNVISYKEENLTVPSPRNLVVEGVENFRDIGGWGKVVDGKYKTFMKQGMLYRSGRFNADKENPVKVTITENGLYEVANHLKIKTEIDLRRSSNNEIGSLTSSVLGEFVNYHNLPMYFGGNNILTFTGKASKDDYQYDNPAAIKQFFDILAVEENYPINFHCSIGKDRTGCMAYLIEGLLGFDQEIMYRDYMFTNFADAGMCKMTDITDRYGKTLDDYEGENLQEKVYGYLNNVIGVSKENLDNIINILKVK